MRPIGCPKTSLTNHKSTLRNISEEGLSHFYRSGSLKSSTIITVSLTEMQGIPTEQTKNRVAIQLLTPGFLG